MIMILLKNLLGYDAIIILLAVINAFYVVPRLKKTTRQLRKSLQNTVYLPIELIMDSLRNDGPKRLDLHELQELREKEVKSYHLFDTVNSLFPLLGILGTIVGLLLMTESGSREVMGNFMIALTSTFWGLIFSIFFKAYDAGLSPAYYQNGENVRMLFERIDLGFGEEKVKDGAARKK